MLSKLIYTNKRSNFGFMVFSSVQKRKCWVSCDWKTASPLSGKDVSTFRWRRFVCLDVRGALSEVLGRKDRATVLHRQHCQPEAHQYTCTISQSWRSITGTITVFILTSQRGTSSWDSSHCWKQDIWDESVCAFEHVLWVNLQLMAASRQNLQASDVISDVIINESFQDKIKAWMHKK